MNTEIYQKEDPSQLNQHKADNFTRQFLKNRINELKLFSKDQIVSILNPNSDSYGLEQRRISR